MSIKRAMKSQSGLTIADANLTLLTGDDWASWFETSVNEATESIHLSIYMISDHWRSPEVGQLNLVKTLASAAKRGLNCRCIIDQQKVLNRRIKFNTQAATKLQAAGWKIRVMPANKTLHEKVMLIDKSITVLGSHNISKASAISNYDTSLAIESAQLAEKIYRQFWERWRVGVPFTGDIWQQL